MIRGAYIRGGLIFGILRYSLTCDNAHEWSDDVISNHLVSSKENDTDHVDEGDEHDYNGEDKKVTHTIEPIWNRKSTLFGIIIEILH